MVDAENFLYIHHFRPNPTIAHFHPHHSTFDASSASLTARTGIPPKAFGPIRESDGKCRLRWVGFQLQIHVEHEKDSWSCYLTVI